MRFNPVPRREDVTFYVPAMGCPSLVTVTDWFRFNRSVLPAARAALRDDDEILPPVGEAARLRRLSTGEQKRLLLWSLLRRPTLFTFLDEPYEHLSPTAKTRLTDILYERAQSGVVVVATNQEVPRRPNTTIVELA